MKPRKRYYTNPGSIYLATYQEEIKNGVKTLVKTGETNVYERIQEDLEPSKIENILHAVAMGDMSVLNQREGTYCDATTMPKTLMEAQNFIVKAKAEFEKYPAEIKKEFGNSAEKYVEMMGTKEFLEIMKPYSTKMAEIEKAGSLKEYNKKVAAEAKFQKDVEAAKGVSNE